MEKEVDNTAVKDIGNLFKLKKENIAIKNRLIRDIRNPFEHEEEDYYKPVRVGNFWGNNLLNMKVTVVEIKPQQLIIKMA